MGPLHTVSMATTPAAGYNGGSTPAPTETWTVRRGFIRSRSRSNARCEERFRTVVEEEVIPAQREVTHWDRIIESDALKMGWGAYSQGVSTGGPWTAQESVQNINYLELLTAFLALKIDSSTEDHLNSAQNSQHYGNRLHQPNGRYTFNSTVDTGDRALEVVHGARYHNSCMQSTYLLVWRTPGI